MVNNNSLLEDIKVEITDSIKVEQFVYLNNKSIEKNVDAVFFKNDACDKAIMTNNHGVFTGLAILTISWTIYATTAPSKANAIGFLRALLKASFNTAATNTK